MRILTFVEREIERENTENKSFDVCLREEKVVLEFMQVVLHLN